MAILKKYIIIISFFTFTINHAQQKDSIKRNTQVISINNQLGYEYSKPKFFDMFRYIPKDLISFGKYTIQKENFSTVGLSLISTVALIPIDQEIADGASRLGSHIRWDEDATYTRVAGLFPIIPDGINSAVYYIGNGGTTLILGGMFYAIGKINNDYRALNTASELVEILMSVGVVTQTIKRITGRQSPNKAFESGNPGGAWRLLPSFKAYQENTPNYDAMPSGHLATFMATVTVIAINYPEIKWIKPVGYSLAGLLAFQMVSGKVHWVSDYPIAIVIGYVIGKNAAKRRIKKHREINIGSKEIKFKTNYSISSLYGDTVAGIRITF